MLQLKKSTLRRGGVILLVLILGAVMVSNVLGAEAVTVITAPVKTNAGVYIDLDGDGLNDPEEFVGYFDVYDGMQSITFSWNAYSFASGVNGSYRVALWQNKTPLGAPAWAEVASAHHWASNPNGTKFTMGPFGPGQLCVTCPSRFVVEPETYVQVYNSTTQTYEYVYTPISAGWSTGVASLEQSKDIIVNVTDYSTPPADKGEDEPHPPNQEPFCGDLICQGSEIDACSCNSDCVENLEYYYSCIS
jgi:hypothetical protein